MKKHYVFIDEQEALGFNGSYNAEKKAKALWEQGIDAVLVIQTPNFYIVSNGVNLNQQVYSFDEVSKLLAGQFANQSINVNNLN